ncbi:MAG: oligopeptide ABC transporter permease OppB [Gammaproteobacteria bacterium]|nr:oligopeptide ABC transporter permease OppB [Gammaproteobacteria bacterium]
MLGYALSRATAAIPTLFLLVTLAFFLIRLAPGGPFDNERQLSPAIEANLQQRYHLDEPLLQQYGRYLWGIARGDFGPSFQYPDLTVTQLIAAGFPVSFTLGGCAMTLALIVGVLLGAIAAINQNGIVDYGVMTVAMLGISMPSFVLAPLLILWLAVYLGWLPAGGLESWRHFVLPVITLAAAQIAFIARLTRGSLIEVLSAQFIRTARAKGLPMHVIFLRHAAPAALAPVVSYLGPATAGIITGSVVIETIFGIPGLGRHFVNGALNRDYTLVLGVVLFYGLLVIVLNLVVDLLYAWLDPRVKY